MKYLVKVRKVISQEIEVEVNTETFPEVTSCIEAMNFAEQVTAKLDNHLDVNLLKTKDSGWHAASVKTESE